MTEICRQTNHPTAEKMFHMKQSDIALILEHGNQVLQVFLIIEFQLQDSFSLGQMNVRLAAKRLRQRQFYLFIIGIPAFCLLDQLILLGFFLFCSFSSPEYSFSNNPVILPHIPA